MLKLRIADQRANPKYDFNQEELDSITSRIANVRAKDMALKISDLDIRGEDLMQSLNINPGKELGDVLKYLLDKVLDDPVLNEKSRLLELAKEYFGLKG